MLAILAMPKAYPCFYLESRIKYSDPGIVLLA